MTPIFLDTNVVIDLLARREPFYKEAQILFTLADRGQIQLQISALSFANASYALAKHYPVADAKKYLQQFKVLVTILPLDDKAIELALASEFQDIEDGFQYFVAQASGAGVIVTRNKKDFKKSEIPVLTPAEFLKR
jgi:predicted nucleic acid-binding protein